MPSGELSTENGRAPISIQAEMEFTNLEMESFAADRKLLHDMALALECDQSAISKVNVIAWCGKASLSGSEAVKRVRQELFLEVVLDEATEPFILIVLTQMPDSEDVDDRSSWRPDRCHDVTKWIKRFSEAPSIEEIRTFYRASAFGNYEFREETTTLFVVCFDRRDAKLAAIFSEGTTESLAEYRWKRFSIEEYPRTHDKKVRPLSAQSSNNDSSADY